MRLKLVGALGKCKMNGYENIEWIVTLVFRVRKKGFWVNTSVNFLLPNIMLIAHNSLGLMHQNYFATAFFMQFRPPCSRKLYLYLSLALCFMMVIVFVKSFKATLFVT